jgi:uncharacterized protein (TIGR02231 family)
VVVCPGWARVEREGECQVQAGQTTLALRTRAERLITGSVLAWVVAGEAQVVGLQVSPWAAADDHEAALRALAAGIAELNQSLAQARSEQEGAGRDLSYLEKLAPWQADEALPKERTLRSITAAEVTELAEYLSKARTQALSRQAQATERQRSLEEELGRQQKQLDALRQHGPERAVAVTVDLAADTPATVRLAVSYTVPGASWYPRYLVQDGAQPGEVNLRLVGVVQQATGEDWDQARVTLSLLPPWGPGAWRPEDAGWLLDVVGRLVQPAPGADGAAVQPGWTEVNAVWVEWSEAKGPPEQLTAVTRVRDNLAAAAELGRQLGFRGTAWETVCAAAATVRGDGSAALVTAVEGNLTAKRAFHLAPATSPWAAATGRARNAWPVAWLPGSVSSPRLAASGVLGTIGFAANGDEADIPLGVDTTVSGEKRVGPARPVEPVAEGRMRTAWPCRLIVRNGSAAAANVELVDALPTVGAGAEVRLLESIPRAAIGPGGRLTWTLTVPPAGSLEVAYTIQADYPADTLPPVLQSHLPQAP